ncbi:flavin-dependent monooxygenase [Novosphingobium sp. MMS21-SN21R]|uniref:flavin-dependent monooxygenase n=1 Tax=Novosphingobium sp. MMS21-SN21R TaxID=2969298 RepID=UPI002883CB17|nr:flavin-dependent monooxygenase [Novosphingobium sp. MMS21-SN21R]MDT0509717.1 flavin-dependent monooxygenase [Novosphingobium sp. MMS21-SN21R]
MASSTVHAAPDRADPQQLLDAARALVPHIIAARDEANRRADVLPQTVAAIQAAGLLRAFQPARWGGLELDPRHLYDLQNVFAEHCLSTAWVFGVLSVQSFMLGRMDPLAQSDVWGDDPDTLVSSSFAPVGRVTPAEGGYRISGRFTFSSGSSHARWAVVGGMVPPDDARPAPQMRLFLVPMADYRIDRVWDTFGLRATGSNDLLIEDAFVPAYRTYVPDSGLLPLPATSGLSALYRLPWLYVFASSISSLAIGAARGALAAFTASTRERQGAFGSGASRDNPRFLSIIGRARVEIDTVERQFHANYARLADLVARNEALPMDEALLYRAELTGFMRRLVPLVDEMMLLLGGRGIQRDGPLTQLWLDLSAARAHAGNDPAAVHAQMAGEMLKP